MKGKVEETSRPPLGEIRAIIGGSLVGQSTKSKKSYLKEVQNVQLSGRSLRMMTTDEQAITFTDADAERVHHPHDDAIVNCRLYYKKGVGGQQKFSRYFILPCLSADEARTRPTSSSKFTIGRIWWNEGVACRHCHITYCSGSIPTIGKQGCEFLGSRLFILL